MTLIASLACIVCAAVAAVVWIFCLGEDTEPNTSVEFDLMTSD